MFPIIRRMKKIATIHTSKRPPRIHFIDEWLEHRELSQAEVVRELDVNKSTVSKWCKGDLPSEKYLLALAEFLRIEPPALFRHPLDDWMTQFFVDRSAEQLARMVDTLKAAFPHEDKTPDGTRKHQSGIKSPEPKSEDRVQKSADALKSRRAREGKKKSDTPKRRKSADG